MWAISVFAFVIIQLPPGDFVDAYIANSRPPAASVSMARREALRELYGLDQPIYVQYFKWMSRMLVRRFRRVDGMAAAGDRGDRRPALAHDRLSRSPRWSSPGSSRCRSASTRRSGSIRSATTSSRSSASSASRCRTSCSRWSSCISRSRCSARTSAGCSRPSIELAPWSWPRSGTWSSTCRCRR